MSTLTLFDIILTLIQIMVLVPVIIMFIRISGRSVSKLVPVFFTFAMISYLLSDVYWIVYNYLRPDTREPLTANEIAECAAILLLSATLESLIKDKKHKNDKNKMTAAELAYSVIFIGANIALWIIWSGEWVEDILFGIPYIYILYLVIDGIVRTKAMDLKHSLTVLILSLAVLLMLVAALFLTGTLYSVAAAASYVCAYVIFGYLFGKCVGFLCKSDGGVRAILMSAGAFEWSLLVTFMSDGVMYIVAGAAVTASIILMYLAYKKEVIANDIC